MRILLVLLFLPVFLRAQCPDPDSIIRQRNGIPVVFPGVDIYPPYTPIPIPPIMPNPIPPYYDITPYAFVWVTALNGKMPLPPVNQDLPMGAKKWLGRGYCQVYYPNREDSVLLAKGRYLNRKKTGTWTWYYDDESKLCEGKYVNGLKTGVWTEYNSEEVSTGSFVAGRKEGVWKTYQQNDTGEKILLNTGTYHQGLSHGTWTFYENGVKTEQQTTAFGLRHGKTTGYYSNGKISSVENYVHGTQMSAYQYDEYGRITEISHTGNDTRTEIYYEEGGGKQVTNFKNGNLHGWKYIYAGQRLVSKEYFFDGMRHGVSTVISDDEKTVTHFRKDLQHGTHIRYKKNNGQWILVEKTNYSHGLEDGNRFDLAYDGSKHYCVYKSGALHGREYWLGKTGDTLSSVVFKDGAEEGRKISVNGTGKTIAYYQHGKLVSESKYESDRMVYEHFFRNGHTYEKSQTKPLPGNRLREEILYPNGTIRNVRTFSAEGKDTVYTQQYFANGKLQSTEVKINGRPDGENMVLNAAGDTLSYNRYLYGRLEGRHIETSSISPTRTMVYKSHYHEGMRKGAVVLYAVDSITDGKKMTSIALFASGNMYKNQPFGHWNLYFYNGALKYDGCLCGVLVTESPRYPAYDPELNVRPVLLMNNSVYCGDYLLYHSNGVLAEKRQGDVWEQYDQSGIIITQPK